MNSINLVAHRGYAKQYPENTLISLVEAIQAGARFIETDVQLSLDKVPVLYHDPNLKRVSHTAGAIHDYRFSELMDIPAHEPRRFGEQFIDQRITPLADLVRLLIAHPQVHAFIEIKRCAIDRHGIDTVYRQVTERLTPVVSQSTLISFSIPFIDHLRQAGWPSLGIVLKRWSDIQSLTESAIKPEFIFCNYKLLPRSGDLRIPGSKLVVYEVDQAQIALDLHERGAAMIETFAIAELLAALLQRFDVPP